eukprot:399948_1
MVSKATVQLVFVILFHVVFLIGGSGTHGGVPNVFIESDCRSVVLLLPSNHFATAPFFEFGCDNNVKSCLYQKCISRYHQLLDIYHKNQEIIQFDHSMENKSSLTGSSKPDLYVLDMDKTLLDQDNFGDWQRFLQEMSSVTFNTKDLNFGVTSQYYPSGVTGVMHRYLVVYRQFLMRFINDHQQNAHFMIYTLAEPAVSIPHLILIELFFNYVYQLTHPVGIQTDWSEFKFDHVIFRLYDTNRRMMEYKSLPVVMKLVGDISRFDRILIVDDMGSDIWLGTIPSALVHNSCHVLAVQPSQLEIRASDNIGYTFIILQRALDKHLLTLIEFLQNEAQKHKYRSLMYLEWTPLESVPSRHMPAYKS